MTQSQPLPDNAPVDPLDEQLVAYLDGELDQAERDTLEQRLVDDQTLRERLQQLQSGWEMLDELPQTSVREQFTETTLEMVAADVSQDVKAKQSRRWRKQWTLPTVAALLAVVALGVGAGAVAAKRQWEMRRQLRDLPLAQHLDAYRYADDLALMRALTKDPDWQTHVDAAVKLRQMRFPKVDLQAVPITQRDETLAQMEMRDRERLAENWRSFQRLSDEQRQQIREVAQQVQSDSQAQKLLQTMDAYARWYQSLDDQTRAALDEAEGPQREVLMHQAMERSRRDWISRSGPLLNDDDVEAIYDVLQTAASDWVDMIEHDDEALSRLDRVEQWVLKRRVHGYAMYNQTTPEAALLNYVFVRRNPLRSSGVGESRGPAGPESLDGVFRLTDWEYATIPSILSENAQDQLAAVVTPELQRELLNQWIFEAVLRTTGDVKETLPRSERLMAMDPEQREELELAPPATIFGRLDRTRGTGYPSSGSPGRGSFRGPFRPGGPPSPPAAEPSASPAPAEPASPSAK